MAQPFYAQKMEMKIGPSKGKTVYFTRAYYYGTISTKQIAVQIAQESALTQADVIAVLERLAYFCQSHTALGYRIKLDGIGVFYNELLTEGSVGSADEVTARLVKSVRPAFKPEYTIMNKSFRYAMLPEKVELVKIDINKVGTNGATDDGSSSEDDNTQTPPGGNDGGNTGSGDDGGDGGDGGDDTVLE